MDPTVCDAFAGELKVPGSDSLISYDYCFSPSPSSRINGSACNVMKAEFEQCGGKSKCTEFGCGDRAWSGECGRR